MDRQLAGARRPALDRASVLIPVRNGARTLPAQLEALAGQTYARDWEVVVADNGSTDASTSIARRFSGSLPGLQVVDASDRKGSPHALNVAAAAARGEFLAVVDGDDVASPDWLEGLVEAARSYDIVGGAMDVELLNDPVSRAWRGKLPREELRIGMRFLPATQGANLGIWRDVLDALGGWNELFVSGSDWDLCFRAQLQGYRIGFAPNAVVHYRLRNTIQSMAAQRFRFGQWNVLLYREHRRDGVPRPGLHAAASVWVRLLLDTPMLLASRKDRGVWVGRFAYRAGRLAGSVRFGVLFP